MLQTIGVAACVLATITISTGCKSASTAASLLKAPPPSHITHVGVKVRKGGIGDDPMLGEATLGYWSGYATITTVPVWFGVASNGVPWAVVPNFSEGFMDQGKSMIFGSAGSSDRLSTGQAGCNTGLAQTPDINWGFYGTNNLMNYQAFAAASNAQIPLATKTVQTVTGTGTNQVTTTTTTSTPITGVAIPGL